MVLGLRQRDLETESGHSTSATVMPRSSPSSPGCFHLTKLNLCLHVTTPAPSPPTSSGNKTSESAVEKPTRTLHSCGLSPKTQDSCLTWSSLDTPRGRDALQSNWPAFLRGPGPDQRGCGAVAQVWPGWGPGRGDGCAGSVPGKVVGVLRGNPGCRRRVGSLQYCRSDLLYSGWT